MEAHQQRKLYESEAKLRVSARLSARIWRDEVILSGRHRPLSITSPVREARSDSEHCAVRVDMPSPHKVIETPNVSLPANTTAI